VAAATTPPSGSGGVEAQIKRMVEEGVEVFKCPNCGAPIEVTPDSLVIRCRYCGYIEYRDPGFEVLTFPSIGREKIEEIFWRRMREDADMRKFVGELSIDSILELYVPYYVVPYDAQYFFVGERTEVRTSEMVSITIGGSGSQTVPTTVTKRVKVKDSGSLSSVEAILARRHVEELGVKELTTQVTQLDLSSAVPAKEYDWRRESTAVMGFDIEPREVPLLTKDVVAEKIKRWVKRKYRLEKIDVIVCRVNVKDFKAVLVPLYIVTYRFRNALYSIAFSGVDGRQLVALEPMLPGYMMLYVGGAVASIFVAGALIPLSLTFSVFSLLGTGVLTYVAYHLIRKALGGVRFER